MLDTAPDSTIHYTLDGSVSIAGSPTFIPARLVFLVRFYGGMRGVKAGDTIRTVAIQKGYPRHDVSHFVYTIERHKFTSDTSQLILPGIRMIRDSFNDQFFPVEGTRAICRGNTGATQIGNPSHGSVE